MHVDYCTANAKSTNHGAILERYRRLLSEDWKSASIFTRSQIKKGEILPDAVMIERQKMAAAISSIPLDT